MAKVVFYTSVRDRLSFSCRLARTVLKNKERLLIVLPDKERMAKLDEALWSFDPDSFIAHDCYDSGSLPQSPVVLSLERDEWPSSDLPENVLNLSQSLFFRPAFKRVLEIVGDDADSLSSARERFRAYRDAGFALEHHAMG